MGWGSKIRKSGENNALDSRDCTPQYLENGVGYAEEKLWRSGIYLGGGNRCIPFFLYKKRRARWAGVMVFALPESDQGSNPKTHMVP